MFISFEGIDGSGKTSRARETAAALRERGYDVLLTREPGGTSISDQIRAVLLDNLKNTEMQPRTELLLFCASRAQLVEQVIRPHLARGGLVLCDRYADSTLAYQGYGHQLDIDAVRQILAFATGGLMPDLTVYLDVDPALGLERRRRGRFQGEDWNRLDAMEAAFYERVIAGYETLIAAEPGRWLRVDASPDPHSVQAAVMAALHPQLTQEAANGPGDV